MNSVIRLITLYAATLGASAVVPFCVVGAPVPTVADASPAGISDSDFNRLVAELQPVWSSTASLEAGFGYKDNLLLSHTNPERSGFARATLEALLWRLPKGRFDYVALLNAAETRYFRSTVVNHEAEAFLGLEGRYRLGDALGVTLDAQGYYLDQIFDVSDTDVHRVVAELKVKGLKVGPTVRWSIRPWLWVEGKGARSRETYREDVYNSTISEESGRLGWTPTEWFELSGEHSESRRHFDNRGRFTADGALDDRLLVVHENQTEGRAAVSWGRSKHWKTTTRIGRLRYVDNGSGYLNYIRRSVGQTVEWSANAWLVRFEGSAKRRVYELQTIGRGLAPPPQIKEEFDTRVRVERKLSRTWTVFGEYRWERSRSNDVPASYRMNEGLLGARWSWEK